MDKERTVVWEKKVGDWEISHLKVPRPDGEIWDYAVMYIEQDGEEYCFNFMSGWGCEPDQITEEMLYALGNYLLSHDASHLIFWDAWETWQRIQAGELKEGEIGEYYL